VILFRNSWGTWSIWFDLESYSRSCRPWYIFFSLLFNLNIKCTWILYIF